MKNLIFGWFLVGMTGVEPAWASSQTLKTWFFTWFYGLFGAFASRLTAFVCSSRHKIRVVRSRKWSKVWSAVKPSRISAASCRLRWPHKGLFFCLQYSIKPLGSQLISQRKDWGAVGKENGFAPIGVSTGGVWQRDFPPKSFLSRLLT